MIVAHIGIRMGSKGLENKNLMDFHGLPLYQRKLTFLLGYNLFDHIIFSCDSSEILGQIEENSRLLKVFRPDYLATDNANKWDVFKHSIEKFRSTRNVQPSILIDFDVTVPNLRHQTVLDFLKFAQENASLDCIMTAYESERNPYFNMVEINGSGLGKVVCKTDNFVASRQSAPEVFSLSPAIYWMRTDALMKHSHWSTTKFSVFQINRFEAIDIDTEFDFYLCKSIYSYEQGF
jgi:N-acylneuraminate cytidylyltransferase/CMP-N,N'-diacetyllegionaminic acid synthase